MKKTEKKIKLPIVLLIFDGFGWNPVVQKGNAVFFAKMPALDFLQTRYPWTTLKASGESVGLLSGFVGNSEVGHLTIGAGRVIPSSLKRIDQLVNSADFFQNKELKDFFSEAKRTDKIVHFLGLVSDGGVHSHIDHLIAFLRAAAFYGVGKCMIHAWLDGRDVAPRSAAFFLEKLESVLSEIGVGSIASVAGRLYAMDRDKNYQRTDSVVDLLTGKKNGPVISWQKKLESAYESGIDDQYITPSLSDPKGIIKPDDFLFFFNVRPERMQQIVERLCIGHQGKKISLTSYWDQLPEWAPVSLLLPEKITDGFLSTISAQLPDDKKRIITIAESEKKAHVGYYLHGNNHQLVSYEESIIIPSDHYDSYAQYPEMKAAAITQTILSLLDDSSIGLIVANFANADMVAHSGDFDATVLACKELDRSLGLVFEKVMEKKGSLVLTADHGNAEEMIDQKKGTKSNAHSANPVLFLIAAEELQGLSFKIDALGLSSVAATIIELLDFEKAKNMDASLRLKGS